jgi:hypothetical protein
MHNKTVCYVQHICKKFNFHNGTKNFTATDFWDNFQYSIDIFGLKKKLELLQYQEYRCMHKSI